MNRFPAPNDNGSPGILFRALGPAAFAVALSLILLTGPADVQAQLTSVLPGMPSAGVPELGRSQSRVAIGAQFGRELPSDATAWAAGARMAWGRSSRFMENAEWGYSLTWADVTYQRYAEEEESGVDPGGALDAHALFGLRLGAKYRVLSLRDLDGNGWQAALFATARPALTTVASLRMIGDSTTIRGIGLGPDEDPDPEFEPWTEVSRQAEFGIVVDYTSPRLFGTVGLGVESGTTGETGVLDSYSGITPRVGASYRLNPGLAVGFSFWGNGSPAWAGESRVRGLDRNSSLAGIVLTFGEPGGSGSDFMISTPFGTTGESVRIHIRNRGFR